MLKTVHANKAQPKPIKLFEVSDVVLRSDTTDVGTINQRRICALYCGVLTGFELLHGLLGASARTNDRVSLTSDADRLMEVLDVLTVDAKQARAEAFERAKKEGRRAMPVNQVRVPCASRRVAERARRA